MANEDESQVAAFIGSTQVCKRLGINRTELQRRIELGLVKPAGKLPGKSGAYLFDAAYIDALAAASDEPRPDGPSWPPRRRTDVPYDVRNIS